MLNCPLCFETCDLCRYYWREKCYQSLPATPVTDIMTESEFREYILKQRTFVKPDEFTQEQFHKMQVSINDQKNDLDEHIDISKKKAQTKRNDYEYK